MEEEEEEEDLGKALVAGLEDLSAVVGLWEQDEEASEGPLLLAELPSLQPHPRRTMEAGSTRGCRRPGPRSHRMAASVAAREVGYVLPHRRSGVDKLFRAVSVF